MYAKPNKMKLHCEAPNYEPQTWIGKTDYNFFSKIKSSQQQVETTNQK